VFSDDFNGAANSAPSSANWLYDLGTSYPGGAGNWGTGEVESNTSSTANVYLDGSGDLAVKPIRDGAGNWTSGRIETQRTDFHPPTGGVMRTEARIQMPNVTGAAAAGYWPAFWSMGAPARGVGRPTGIAGLASGAGATRGVVNARTAGSGLAKGARSGDNGAVSLTAG